MDTHSSLLIPLDQPGPWEDRLVGGKAGILAQLTQAGFNVPRGVCLTTGAYDAFVRHARLSVTINMELARKSMDDLRWEELWDSALRIRAAFMNQPLPSFLQQAIVAGLNGFSSSTRFAVRSSAVGEDAEGHSFAGLHESIIGVRGYPDLENAVRQVWASLWSDAALLYRKELGLNPASSRMAVVIQELVDAEPSGVAFARDPRDPSQQQAIIEAVSGPCSLLVDGVVEPERWEVDRLTHQVLKRYPGQSEPEHGESLLQSPDIEKILQTLSAIEQQFQWPPDMEWTGRHESLTVLQARPISTLFKDPDEKRGWYLTLRPGDTQLKALRHRVAEQLIPELEDVGKSLAAEPLDALDDDQLAEVILERRDIVKHWKKIYWDEFIPFAHGVRRLATYYNDAVQPDDPYEFVGLLRGQPLLATKRNQAIVALARTLARNEDLRTALEKLLDTRAVKLPWDKFRHRLLLDSKTDSARTDSAYTVNTRAVELFAQGFDDLHQRFLDITYDHGRLFDRPGAMLQHILELSKDKLSYNPDTPLAEGVDLLEQRLLDAVGGERQDEALDMLETGRISWKLRDDDNLLVARLESQLLRALNEAAQRLRGSGRLSGEQPPKALHTDVLLHALQAPKGAPPIVLEVDANADECTSKDSRVSDAFSGEMPRQLIGQPASPGMMTGPVHCIRSLDDLGKFRRGEVLVCDAIEPMMTHLVPLAGAVIERRGGMLIHGAIIARELGIPCVNGIHAADSILKDGDLVTVDGCLGIVTVGDADFDLELAKPDVPD